MVHSLAERLTNQDRIDGSAAATNNQL